MTGWADRNVRPTKDLAGWDSELEAFVKEFGGRIPRLPADLTWTMHKTPGAKINRSP